VEGNNITHGVSLSVWLTGTHHVPEQFQGGQAGSAALPQPLRESASKPPTSHQLCCWPWAGHGQDESSSKVTYGPVARGELIKRLATKNIPHMANSGTTISEISRDYFSEFITGWKTWVRTHALPRNRI